jgi:hypothetical protein
MKLMYDIRSETGLHHDRVAATGERDALRQFANQENDCGHIVQCGNQRTYLVIDDFAFYAEASQSYSVKETSTLGLSLPLFSGSETECYEWIAAQKLSGDKKDYIVKIQRSH